MTEGEKIFITGAERFLEVNAEYWKREPSILDGDRWIYVLHTLHQQFITTTLEAVIAKGLQAKERLPVASITSGRAGELMKLTDRLDGSFGIEQRYHLSYHDYNSAEIEALADKLTLETYGDKDALLRLTYRDIKLGDSLYDDILRRGNTGNRGEAFDCFDISRERYRFYIRNALALIDQAYEIFSERKPAYLVVSEYFYTRGLYANVASVLGAKIVIALTDTPDIMVQIDSEKHLLSDVTYSDILKAQKEKCMGEFRSTGERHENLFVMGSGTDETEGAMARQGKKNVLILPHSFSDSPREVCRHSIYRDYCEWFLDTIRMVREIPDVNWIIKDHPWSVYYGQENFVRSVFERNKTENMHWIDKERSGMKMKDIVDCVLAGSGDAGLEYWAYGIPTVTTGDAYYCDWGVSYHARSLREYEKILRDIGSLEKPPEQSVDFARRCLEAYNGWHKTGDPFAQTFYGFRMKDLSVWKATGCKFGISDFADAQMGQIVSDFCGRLVELIQEKGWKTSAIYQLTFYTNM